MKKQLKNIFVGIGVFLIAIAMIVLASESCTLYPNGENVCIPTWLKLLDNLL